MSWIRCSKDEAKQIPDENHGRQREFWRVDPKIGLGIEDLRYRKNVDLVCDANLKCGRK